MKNSINFPALGEVDVAQEDAYLAISQSKTQKPFKIKASKFFNSLANIITNVIISTDQPNSLILGSDGFLTSQMNTYAASFFTGSFSGGVLNIPESSHQHGAGLKHVTVFDSAGDIVNSSVTINVNYLNGDVKVVASPFDGQILITSISY